MSTDRLVLTALERRTKARLRYAELVELRAGLGGAQVWTQRCYLGIGDHVLFLVCHNLSGLLKPCGELSYGSIDSAVQEARSVDGLVLFLNQQRPSYFKLPQVLILSEHRSRLVAHLRCAWQTSYQIRKGAVGELPLHTANVNLAGIGEVSRGPAELAVQAFHDYKVVSHDGYSFFLKKDFNEGTNGLLRGNPQGCFVDSRDLMITVQIQEPRPVSELLESGNDQHIRWVASRQRQAMAEEMARPLIMRNNFYHKKMNLASDIASWTGWEILVKSDTEVRVVISLRRQYLPPLMDSAQDIFVTLLCPKHVLDSDQSITEAVLLNEARITADSVSPLVHRCIVPQLMYRDMIQARLDALLFDADSMEWLQNILGCKPDASLVLQARIFVKSLLKILQEETVLRTSDLLHDVGVGVPTEKEPIAVPSRMQPVGYKHHAALGTDNNPVMNAWLFRVAKYLAWCLDGGLCGPRLQLQDLICVFITTVQSQAKIDEVVMFLLHMRPKDYSQPYKRILLKYLVVDPDLFETHIFNDRMMQSLVELGWFEEALMRSNGAKVADRGQDALDPLEEYTCLLARLLSSNTASVNLRAAACRRIIARAEKMQRQFNVLCHALVDLSRFQSNLFLRTYATLALATLAGKFEEAHNKIMSLGGVDVCLVNLKSYDDELIRYTLILLTQFTKSVGRIQALRQSKITDIVVVLLEQTPPAKQKHPLLTELCSVIGQLCNDEQVWKDMCHSWVIDKLIEIFKSGAPGGRLRSKAMFAFKMFIDYPTGDQARRDSVSTICQQVIDDLEAGLNQKTNFVEDTLDLDFAANAILLLGSLTKSSHCKKIAALPKVDEILNRLTLAEIGQVDSVREKLQKLQKRLVDIRPKLQKK